MTEYDIGVPYFEPDYSYDNYTLDQDGNVLTYQIPLPTDGTDPVDVNFVSNLDETTYYDYVLRVSSLGNPYEGNPRDRDGDDSYDFTWPD